jgi:hypothetical protein
MSRGMRWRDGSELSLGIGEDGGEVMAGRMGEEVLKVFGYPRQDGS